MEVVSVYTPQVGRPEKEKEKFWQMLDECIGKVSEEELLVIGGDLNGHVGKERNGFEEVMGIYGYGMRNEAGTSILEFCQGRKLRVVNTMFKKKEKQKVTYKSGGDETQVDYMLTRVSEDKMLVENCKVIPGEECLTQHRLMCSDIVVRGIGMSKNKRKKGVRKIKQWKLREEIVRKEFEETVEKEMEGKEKRWERLRDSIMKTGRKICGETTGQFRKRRETWWWNAAVQREIREKKDAYKQWQKSGEKGAEKSTRRRKGR